MSSGTHGVDLINKAPKGSKVYLLYCGLIEADDGWVIRGGSTSTASHPRAFIFRRKAEAISGLIDLPDEGLILVETGAGKDHTEIWGVEVNKPFARVDYKPDQELPEQLKK